MKGWQRRDYAFIAGRTPFQRHIRNEGAQKKEWNQDDDPISEKEIEAFGAHDPVTLEYYIHRWFLTRKEVECLLKNERKTTEQKVEYYDFLLSLREKQCIPAMHDFVAGKFRTMRAALLQRLREQGMEF